MAPAEQPTFSFDTVACLISAMLANGQSIGMSTYEAMSALDGKRSANAFSHQFRAVIRRARELKDEQNANGGKLTPATPKPRAKTESKKGTARPVTKGKKRGTQCGRGDSLG